MKYVPGRVLHITLLLLFYFLGFEARADIFSCGKASGSAIYSLKNFKAIEDGLSNNEINLIVTDSVMYFFGSNKDLETIATTENTISSFAKTTSPLGDVLLIYTFDRRRKVLYISAHKDMTLVNGTGAGVYVAKCK